MQLEDCASEEESATQLLPRVSVADWPPDSKSVVAVTRLATLPGVSSSVERSKRVTLGYRNRNGVLDAIRREHGVRLTEVREAIRYMQDRMQVEHPLAFRGMVTDGHDLFVRRYAQLINVSQEGQLAMADVLDAYLRRVDWDEAGFAIRLYPFTRKRALDEPKAVVIDPEISFGRPVLVGTGVPTSTVADRYKAGESVEELAADYDLKRDEIEEAIRCELRAA